MATRIKIIGGPSLFSFSNAVFDGEIVPHRVLRFSTDFDPSKQPDVSKIDPFFKRLVDDMMSHRGFVQTFSLTIRGVDMEDGSRKRWLFRGYGADVQKGLRVHGYYDTEKREGWVEVI